MVMDGSLLVRGGRIVGLDGEPERVAAREWAARNDGRSLACSLPTRAGLALGSNAPVFPPDPWLAIASRAPTAGRITHRDGGST